MRVDLLEPLRPGDDVEMRIDFEYNIVNGDVLSHEVVMSTSRKMNGTEETISLPSRSGFHAWLPIRIMKVGQIRSFLALANLLWNSEITKFP